MDGYTATVLVTFVVVFGLVALGLGLGIPWLLREKIVASAAPTATARVVSRTFTDDTAHGRIDSLEQRMVGLSTLPGRIDNLENRVHYLRLDLDALIARFDRLGNNVRQSFSAVAAIIGAIIGMLVMFFTHVSVSNGTISARDFQNTEYHFGSAWDAWPVVAIDLLLGAVVGAMIGLLVNYVWRARRFNSRQRNRVQGS